MPRGTRFPSRSSSSSRVNGDSARPRIEESAPAAAPPRASPAGDGLDPHDPLAALVQAGVPTPRVQQTPAPRHLGWDALHAEVERQRDRLVALGGQPETVATLVTLGTPSRVELSTTENCLRVLQLEAHPGTPVTALLLQCLAKPDYRPLLADVLGYPVDVHQGFAHALHSGDQVRARALLDVLRNDREDVRAVSLQLLASKEGEAVAALLGQGWGKDQNGPQRELLGELIRQVPEAKRGDFLATCAAMPQAVVPEHRCLQLMAAASQHGMSDQARFRFKTQVTQLFAAPRPKVHRTRPSQDLQLRGQLREQDVQLTRLGAPAEVKAALRKLGERSLPTLVKTASLISELDLERHPNSEVTRLLLERIASPAGRALLQQVDDHEPDCLRTLGLRLQRLPGKDADALLTRLSDASAESFEMMMEVMGSEGGFQSTQLFARGWGDGMQGDQLAIIVAYVGSLSPRRRDEFTTDLLASEMPGDLVSRLTLMSEAASRHGIAGEVLDAVASWVNVPSSLRLPEPRNRAEQVLFAAAGGWTPRESAMSEHRTPYLERSLRLLAEKIPDVRPESMKEMGDFLVELRTMKLSESDHNALWFHRPATKEDPKDPTRTIPDGFLPETELENAIRAFDAPRRSVRDYGSITDSKALTAMFSRIWQAIAAHPNEDERLKMKIALAWVMAQGIEDDDHRSCGVGMEIRFVAKMGTHFPWLEAVLTTPGELMEQIGHVLYQMEEPLAPRTPKNEREWQGVAHSFYQHAMKVAREIYPTDEDPKLLRMGPPRLAEEFSKRFLEPALDGDDDLEGWRDYAGPPVKIPLG
jgi:hypothetical protein